MNKERRKQIADLISRLRELTIPDLEALKTEMDEIHDGIDEVKEQEQEYFDNMPESLQGGDKGSVAEAAIQALEEAGEALETAAQAVQDVIDLDFQDIMDSLDTAQK